MKNQGEKEPICEICGHEAYSHNWSSENKHKNCIGENFYWSGCNCPGFKMKREKVEIEERCICGFRIPRGYGYYGLGKGIRCFGCGRINFRSHQETPEEIGKKIEEVLK